MRQLLVYDGPTMNGRSYYPRVDRGLLPLTGGLTCISFWKPFPGDENDVMRQEKLPRDMRRLLLGLMQLPAVRSVQFRFDSIEVSIREAYKWEEIESDVIDLILQSLKWGRKDTELKMR